MPNRYCRCFVVVGIGALCISLTPHPVFASATCSVSVSPTLIKSSSTTTIHFSISNNGDSDIQYVTMNAPTDGNFTITGGTGPSGWTATTSDTSISFGGGAFSSGITEGFDVTVSTPDTEINSDNWDTLASDQGPEGGDNQLCGTTGIGIYLYSSPTPQPDTTTTTETTTIVTKIITPTSTPTPTPDRQPPSVSIKTSIKQVFATPPTIQGTASDISGISSIQYSLDAGLTWSTVETLSAKGASGTTYTFVPSMYEDGNYALRVRARDGAGNISAGVQADQATLVIDRLPPQVGPPLLSLGPIIFSPSPNGLTIVPADLPIQFSMSAIGGPTSINLASTAPLGAMHKQAYSGLWSGPITFAPGTYTVQASSIDGANNTTIRTIQQVMAIPSGHITNGTAPLASATISLFIQDPVTKRFVLWDASGYDQRNPQQVTPSGTYQFMLPPGTYTAQIEAPGYRTAATELFTVEHPLPFGSDFALTPRPTLSIGPFTIPLPTFSYQLLPVSLAQDLTTSTAAQSQLVGTTFPPFSLVEDSTTITETTFHGKPTTYTILSSWSPVALEKLEQLDTLARQHPDTNQVVIIAQETTAAVTLLKNRGSYSLHMIADPDGTLIEPLNLQHIPTTIETDKRGMVMRYGL